MDRLSPLIKRLILFVAILFAVGCRKGATSDEPSGLETAENPLSGYRPIVQPLWTPFDQSGMLQANADHAIKRMRFKRIQSLVQDKNEVFAPFFPEVSLLTVDAYARLTTQILDRDIPEIQEQIHAGQLTYEELTRYFLYRIFRYELDTLTTLNTLVAFNYQALDEARRRDSVIASHPDSDRHPIFGMPVLLKDNIGAEGTATTAGAIALLGNRAPDAFITRRLKEKGAIILGKVNLSEWAYYFCGACPVGYSAVGGQTLNPYGRGVFESGGSSSGSGTAMAAGYAVAAVGTETSGSILSPSGQNSVVGIKPTIGLLSRTGIVPISSTLDTPGPMTRSVTDAAILLDAMMGYDQADRASAKMRFESQWYLSQAASLREMRFGVFENLIEEDTLYREAVDRLEAEGAKIILLAPSKSPLIGFSALLNLDMEADLPMYLRTQLRDTQVVPIRSVADVVRFNQEDSSLRAPYGQPRLEGILQETAPRDSLQAISAGLQETGRAYFQEAFGRHRVHAVLSVNNKHASYAAVAQYPALTLPMGYRDSGEPVNLTLIGKPFQERELVKIGSALENLGSNRKWPEAFDPGNQRPR